MAANNFNSVVRSNFSVKPSTLSRTTNDLISNCVENFYSKIHRRFKRDSARVAVPRAENKAPLRLLYSPDSSNPSKPDSTGSNPSTFRKNDTPATNSGNGGSPRNNTTAGSKTTVTNSARSKPRLKGCDPPVYNQKSMSTLNRGNGHVIKGKPNANAKSVHMGAAGHRTGKRQAPSAIHERVKKLEKSQIVARSPLANAVSKRKTKTPTLRIYASTKRYSSSASSSRSSILRREDTRYFKPLWPQYFSRTYVTDMVPQRGKKLDHSICIGASKYFGMQRNQQMQSPIGDLPATCVEITNNIRNDLMSLNGTVKKLIALGKVEHHLTPGGEKMRVNPFSTWNNPTLAAIRKLSQPKINMAATIELQEKTRRLREANEQRQHRYSEKPSAMVMRARRIMEERERAAIKYHNENEEKEDSAEDKLSPMHFEVPSVDQMPSIDQYEGRHNANKASPQANKNCTARSVFDEIFSNNKEQQQHHHHQQHHNHQQHHHHQLLHHHQYLHHLAAWKSARKTRKTKSSRATDDRSKKSERTREFTRCEVPQFFNNPFNTGGNNTSISATHTAVASLKNNEKNAKSTVPKYSLAEMNPIGGAQSKPSAQMAAPLTQGQQLQPPLLTANNVEPKKKKSTNAVRIKPSATYLALKTIKPTMPSSYAGSRFTHITVNPKKKKY